MDQSFGTPTPASRTNNPLGSSLGRRQSVPFYTPARPSPSSATLAKTLVKAVVNRGAAGPSPQAVGLGLSTGANTSPYAQQVSAGQQKTGGSSVAAPRPQAYASTSTPARYPYATQVAPRPLLSTPQNQRARPAGPLVTPSAKGKEKGGLAPLGRREVAKRLRINAVLLVVYWLSSRTNLYGYAAGHAVKFLPILDGPLYYLETILLLLLVWNIVDSMWRLNKLSSLPSLLSMTPSKPGEGYNNTTSPFSTPGSIPRARTLNTGGSSHSLRQSPSYPTLDTPSTPSRSPVNATASGSLLRKSGLGLPGTPSASSPLLGSSATAFRASTARANLGASVKATLPGSNTEGGGVALQSYLIRHSPAGLSGSTSSGVMGGRGIDSREGIERLLSY